MKTATGDDQDAVDMGRLAGGGDAALNDLMERHGERLFRYLIRLLQNEGDAAEAAQESFVRVYEQRAKFDLRRKFSTWLYTIATNLARDQIRWRMRHPTVSLDATVPDSDGRLSDTLPESRPSPSQSIEASERADAVRAAIAGLGEELRVPLVLAEYEERSQAEIATILDCSVKAVEMRIYRARQRLRVQLAELIDASD